LPNPLQTGPGRPLRLVALAVTGLVVFALLPAASAQNKRLEKTFLQGTQALRDGHFEEAATAFSQAVTISPSFAEAHFNLGLTRLQQGHLEEATASLSKSLTLKPSLRGANLFLAIALYRSNDFDKAAAALKREIQIDPASADAFMWLGVVQLAQGKPSLAATSLDEAAALRPGDVDILYHRGRAHMLVSKESYEQMYEIAPASWRVHQVLAQSFVEADRLDDAILECKEALRLKPEEPGLHQALADVYLKKNDLVNAEAEYQNEIQLNPGSLSSKYSLAVVSIERSKAEVAEELLRQVLQAQPRSADANYQMGRAQAQLGNTDGAIRSFSTAVADSGKQTDSETLRQSYYQLAQLYRRARQPEQSKAALDSFLRLKQQADARQAQKLQDKLKRAAESQEKTP
jgi:tetratricopeptide (TPR) repeat protein